MNLGICWAKMNPLIGSFKMRESSPAFEGANKMGQPLLRCCDAIGLQIHPLEDAASELGHS